MGTPPTNTSHRVYDLRRARVDRGRTKEPAAHQKEALASLDRWYRANAAKGGGNILVLPTGRARRFAARFLCVNLASDGYGVLWQAPPALPPSMPRNRGTTNRWAEHGWEAR